MPNIDDFDTGGWPVRGEEREMRHEDVKILQAYEKDGFILVSYLYRCCFEGMIVLFTSGENGLKLNRLLQRI